jgi:hypothetical protein
MKRKYLPRLTSFPFLVALLVIVTVTFATAGSPPVDVHGTTWDTSGSAKGKVKGEGGFKGDMWVDIYFGAQGGLGANEYLAILDDGDVEVEVRGIFSTPKGKLKSMTVLPGPLASELEDLMDDVVPGYDWHVAIKKAKSKAKVKNKKGSISIKYKFKTSWVTTATGYPNSAKAKLSCKTTGHM